VYLEQFIWKRDAKGAHWRSMEMAGIVTKIGADLITQAQILVEQISWPLKLDTDGIWCILPKSFPDVCTFKTVDDGIFRFEYPYIMLNADVHDHFAKHQKQTLTDPARGIYETRSECSFSKSMDRIVAWFCRRAPMRESC
jgi:DNA polymerase epsilon subunit 1